MLRKISAQQFIKPQKRPKAKQPRRILDLGLRTLQDKDHKILEKYSPLLKNLDALTFEKNSELLRKSAQQLGQQDLQQSLLTFEAVSKQFSKHSFTSFEDLYSRHPPSVWEPLNNLLRAISTLEPKIAAMFSSRLLNLYMAPKIVAQKIAADDEAGAVAYIHELAHTARTTVHFEAVNLAINQYLASTGVGLANFKRVFCGLDSRIKPRIEGHIAQQIHLCNTRMDLLEIFELFRDFGVPLNTSHMATFLRALCTANDAGYLSVIAALPDCKFPIVFYHYLVRLLCSKRDEKTVNWLFSNRIMPMMESDPSVIPFFLHALLVRTLEFDGITGARDILTAMGTEVSEQSWKALFIQFRRIGEIERAFETLSKAANTFGVKFSFPLVNDYLLLVSQHHKPSVFFRALLAVFPEHETLLTHLKLVGELNSAGVDPSFMLLPKHRNFVPKGIHESTLALAYEVALNEVFEIDDIMNSYSLYESEALRGSNPSTMAIVDKFVVKLTSLGDAGIDAAENVYRSALTRLKLRKTLNGRFGNTSLRHITTSLAQRGDIKRAIAITTLTSEHMNMPLRGKALRKLYYTINNENCDHGRVFAEWAHSEGLILCPEPASELFTVQPSKSGSEEPTAPPS